MANRCLRRSWSAPGKAARWGEACRWKCRSNCARVGARSVEKRLLRAVERQEAREHGVCSPRRHDRRRRRDSHAQALFGKAPQNMPSAPVLTKTRAPKRCITSVQKRPVPATCHGWALQAARSVLRPWCAPPRSRCWCRSARRRARAPTGGACRHRATVDRATIISQQGAGQLLQYGLDLALDRMVRRRIAAVRRTQRAGGAEKSRMLAGAVVVDRRRGFAGLRQCERRWLMARPMGAAFERVGGKPGAREYRTTAVTWPARRHATRRRPPFPRRQRRSVPRQNSTSRSACSALMAERG